MPGDATESRERVAVLCFRPGADAPCQVVGPFDCEDDAQEFGFEVVSRTYRWGTAPILTAEEYTRPAQGGGQRG
jgi:hypothetical protein